MRIGVIGSGFASLSAATYLADQGQNVTVYEKNSCLGGRARKFVQNGFVFDMGPSWYWMPDVFDRYFENFGKKVSDYYELTRLDPSYRVYYGERDFIDVPADLESLFSVFESVEDGSGERLRNFLSQAKVKYEVGIKDLVYKPGRSITEFFDIRLINGLLKMDVLTPMSRHTEKVVKNPKLKKILDFPLLFLGSTPNNTPALYSLMNYADMVLGTWYPMGGMNKIIEAMVDLATERGVRFITDSAVNQIIPKGGELILDSNSNSVPYDAVVSGADYHHSDHDLLTRKHRNYSSKYWESRTMAPSSLIFYIGVNKKVNNLLHHNLFFDQDFEKHATEIYDEPQWPSDPLFYVCCPSKTDDSVAPEGMENLFVLIPVATGLNDSSEIHNRYFETIISRLERLIGDDLKDHIVYKKTFSVEDFTHEYNSFKGNAYGLANTLKQTAILKPSIRNKKIKNLYYTGQLTVPGPGVPPSIISGEVVAKELLKDLT